MNCLIYYVMHACIKQTLNRVEKIEDIWTQGDKTQTSLLLSLTLTRYIPCKKLKKSFILRRPDLYDIIFVGLMNLVKVIDIPRCKTAIINIVPTDNKHKNLAQFTVKSKRNSFQRMFYRLVLFLTDDICRSIK